MTEVCITIHKSLEEKESDFSKEQNMSPSMSFLFVLAMGFILPLSGVVSVISLPSCSALVSHQTEEETVKTSEMTNHWLFNYLLTSTTPLSLLTLCLCIYPSASASRPLSLSLWSQLCANSSSHCLARRGILNVSANS
jgi:hypothetical protein